MKLIVSCEFSGIVREEFKLLGWDAWSCDLLDTEQPGQHIKDDIRKQDLSKYDLMIAHPPCTHLCVSGARWFKGKENLQKDSLDFVKFHLDAPIKYSAVENPIGIISTYIRKPDQIVQPWWFGEDDNKATCLWLKNLPKLKQTDMVPKIFRDSTVHRCSKSNTRWMERSRTFKGFAHAMAVQWTNYLTGSNYTIKKVWS